MVLKKRAGWLLLALASAHGEALSPVQLQKTLFLLGQKLPDDVGQPYYHFVPYHYGPFDADVYRDADALAQEGLISIGRSATGRWNQYAVTVAGTAEAARLTKLRPKRAVSYLASLVEWVRNLRFDELVRSVYREYPEYRVNSVFRG